MKSYDQQREMYEDCLCQFVMSNFFDEIYSPDFSNVSMVRQIFLWELVSPSKKKTTNTRYLSQWESDRKTTAHTHTNKYMYANYLYDIRP